MLLLLTAAVFLVTTGAIVSGYFWLRADSPVEQRLRSVVPESAVVRKTERPKRTGLGPFGRALAGIGGLTTGSNDSSLTKLLTTAGYRSASAVPLFVGCAPSPASAPPSPTSCRASHAARRSRRRCT
jgi:hypothetical protein